MKEKYSSEELISRVVKSKQQVITDVPVIPPLGGFSLCS